MEIQIPENWQWNNGKYWFYYHCKDGDTQNRTIDLFNSREAQNDFGHFIIDNTVIVSGKMLGATDRESGKQLLIDYVKNLKD